MNIESEEKNSSTVKNSVRRIDKLLFKGFLSEVWFWNRMLSGKQNYVSEMLTSYPHFITQYINDIKNRGVQNPKVLDVGSGPVSVLTYGSQNNNFNLVALDPLANVYKTLLGLHGYKFASQLINGYGENLSKIFGREYFDLVWIHNSLDHSQNPELVFSEMVKVLKPNGYLILQSFCREGTFNNWNGLHQYDLYLNQDKELTCMTRDNNVNVISDKFPVQIIKATEPSLEIRSLIEIIWQKKSQN